MLYRILKFVIGIGIRLYYREIRLKGRKNLGDGGPRIIIANHPNTLMDAWLIGFVCNEPIHFMTKGTFFNTPFKKWILESLGMIPINRASEARTKGVSNEHSFENCYLLLEKGKTLVIFPEGNSFTERKLRTLKSGTARIALEVLKRDKLPQDLKIIPVGLVYLHPEKFRSSVYMNFGDPIDPTPFIDEYHENQLTASRNLTAHFKDRLEDLLIGSKSVEHEKLFDEIAELLSSKYVKSEKKGVEKDVVFYKEVYEKLNEILIRDPERIEQISYLNRSIRYRIHKSEIKPDFLDRNYRPRMFARQLVLSSISVILGLPVFIYGTIHNYLPFKLTDLVISKYVKDIEYYAPMAVLLGLVIYPLNYSGFVWLLDFLFDLPRWGKWCYFLSMPLSGMYAYKYDHYIKHISLKTNFVFLMRTQRDAIELIKQDREQLRTLIFG